jgi:hypothetical protein
VSSLCTASDCTTDKLSGKSINSNNFVCNGNQLDLDVEDVVYKNGICFGGYGEKSTDKPCYYPTQSSYNLKAVGSVVNDLQITTVEGVSTSSNKCYKFKSIHGTCNADTCKKSILKTISQNDFDCWYPSFPTCEYQGRCSQLFGYDYDCTKTKEECRVQQDGKHYVIDRIYRSNDCNGLKTWTGTERETTSPFSCDRERKSSANIIKVTMTIVGSVMGSLLMFW